MKYLDPMPVECPQCGKTREYPAADLRNFRAVCYECNYDLTSIGKEMREGEAYWAYILIDLIDFVLKLEEKLKIQYKDSEIVQLKTFDDMFHLTLSKLPPSFSADQLREIIFVAASEAGNYTASQLSLDMSLRDVLERTA
jgi:hypothetical protein